MSGSASETVGKFSVNQINADKLNCKGCPARNLLDIERIRKVERIRVAALQSLKVPIKFFLLCESAPVKRFIYDRNSNYDSGGLRFNLRNELTPEKTDDSLFNFFADKGIWVIDSALCPLHELESNSDRRLAATVCLSRHTRAYLDSVKSAKVISIFPNNCGFLKKELPDLASRISASFKFNNLARLKNVVDGLEGSGKDPDLRF